ncbi:rhythmically expressed gene 2 protein [Scaptodrosophila lebanonensis]|uniref:Rhythmically expressed gene 2 protein n=1 Tax=Drosophila lebanonensis TaxID=7225 RepID=A0A6J2UDH0_DROLE|nr:rhythmically expressed gene 2 protein [Scaptodrosophila lebanonensis]
MPLSAQFIRNLQRFRLVTFDVTDTLLQLKDPPAQYVSTATACGVPNIDSKKLQLCFRQHFKIMSQNHPNFGRSTPDMGWRSWWLQLVDNVFRCGHPGIEEAKLKQIAEQLLLVFRTRACWTHIECAGNLVQRMRDAGKCVGVISNFDPSLTQVLEEMELLHKFDFVLTSYEAGVMKPDVGIFEIPLKRLNIAPTEALHIGNKYDMDYTGARNSGWSSLLVQTGPEGEVSGSNLDAEAVGHTFASLREMLQTLETKQIVW